jgi:gluconokinase
MVVASGTALTSSPLWRQILADCMGRKLIMEESAVESSARGVAIFVGVALGLHTFEDMGEFQATMLSSIPQVTAHAAYLEARHKQESLYRKLYLES